MGIINQMPNGGGKKQPVGTISIFNTQENRDGYLLCNGSKILKSDYPSLEKVGVDVGLREQISYLGELGALSGTTWTPARRAEGPDYLILGGMDTYNIGVYDKSGNYIGGASLNYSYSYGCDKIPYYFKGEYYLILYYSSTKVVKTSTPQIANSWVEQTATNSITWADILIDTLNYPEIQVGEVNGVEYVVCGFHYPANNRYNYVYVSTDGVNFTASNVFGETNSSGLNAIYYLPAKKKFILHNSYGNKYYDFNPATRAATQITPFWGSSKIIGSFDGMFVTTSSGGGFNVYDELTEELICTWSPPATDIEHWYICGQYGVSMGGYYTYITPLFQSRQFKGQTVYSCAAIKGDYSMDYAVSLANNTPFIFIANDASSNYHQYKIDCSQIVNDSLLLPTLIDTTKGYYGYIKT